MKNLVSFTKKNTTASAVMDKTFEEKEVLGVDQTQQRTFYVSILALFMSCAALALVGLRPLTSKQRSIVTVDMNQLIRQKASTFMNEKGHDMSDTMKHIHMDEQARTLRSTLNAYAKANHVTVMAKGAVFGDLIQDVTDAIAALL